MKYKFCVQYGSAAELRDVGMVKILPFVVSGGREVPLWDAIKFDFAKRLVGSSFEDQLAQTFGKIGPQAEQHFLKAATCAMPSSHHPSSYFSVYMPPSSFYETDCSIIKMFYMIRNSSLQFLQSFYVDLAPHRDTHQSYITLGMPRIGHPAMVNAIERLRYNLSCVGRIMKKKDVAKVIKNKTSLSVLKRQVRPEVSILQSFITITPIKTEQVISKSRGKRRLIINNKQKQEE